MAVMVLHPEPGPDSRHQWCDRAGCDHARRNNPVGPLQEERVHGFDEFPGTGAYHPIVNRDVGLTVSVHEALTDLASHEAVERRLCDRL